VYPDAKVRFRSLALERLRSLSPAQKRLADHYIIRALEEEIRALKPRQILLYLPLPLEVDIRPLIATLRRQGVRVYVPFMEGESFRPVQYRLPLKRKRFGVYEPNHSKQYRPRIIEMAVVPVLGIDPTLRRIGFGKGYYDRFFEKEKKTIQKIIFLQRRLCCSTEILTRNHDIGADLVIAHRSARIPPLPEGENRRRVP